MMSGPEWCGVASFYQSLKLLQRDLVLEEVVIQARATATPWHLSKYSCCTLSQQFLHWCGAFALGSRRVMGGNLSGYGHQRATPLDGGSVITYYSDRIEEIILAEQGELTEGEKPLLELLKKKLRRELEKAA